MIKFSNEIRAQLVVGTTWWGMESTMHDEDRRQFSYHVPNYDLLRTACDELLDYIAQRTDIDYKDKFIQNLHEVIKQHNRIVISGISNSPTQQISTWAILRTTAQQISTAFDMTFEIELSEIKHG